MAKNIEGRRVLIYGAGDGGELVLRELLNNRGLKYSPVGFLDDDPAKSGKLIHGLKVYGGNGDLNSVCEQQQVDEILISSSRMTDERLQEILRLLPGAKYQGEAHAYQHRGFDGHRQRGAVEILCLNN